MRSSTPPAALVVAALTLVAPLACGPAAQPATTSIGVLLSFSGYLAADSINSERALLMAVEAANAAGGIGGRRVELAPRDMRSDPRRAAAVARELVDANVVAVIGPDTVDLAIAARTTLIDTTVVLPSFASTELGARPPSWFVLGTPTNRIACELNAQLRADGRRNPLLIMNPHDYASAIGWMLTNVYGLPKYVLPSDEAPTPATLQPITSANADAFVLVAFPTSAASLVFALAAMDKLGDPGRWYLSPMLHTPAFLATLPTGVLAGAHGVSPATGADGANFRRAFELAWDDLPLDNAYAYYDAAAVVVLALQRALTREGAIARSAELGKHVLAVTRPSGTPVRWNEIAHGLELLRQGQEVGYVGLTGSVEFDTTGQTPGAVAKWWTVNADGFADVPSQSDCR